VTSVGPYSIGRLADSAHDLLSALAAVTDRKAAFRSLIGGWCGQLAVAKATGMSKGTALAR
jgi:hypothetical protein